MKLARLQHGSRGWLVCIMWVGLHFGPFFLNNLQLWSKINLVILSRSTRFNVVVFKLVRLFNKLETVLKLDFLKIFLRGRSSNLTCLLIKPNSNELFYRIEHESNLSNLNFLLVNSNFMLIKPS